MYENIKSLRFNSSIDLKKNNIAHGSIQVEFKILDDQSSSKCIVVNFKTLK